MKWFDHVTESISKPWYSPFIAFLAFIDFFIFVVPTDGILISSALLKRKFWLRFGLWVSIGSALGALLAAVLFQGWAALWFQGMIDRHMSAESWIKAKDFLEHYGGWFVWFSAWGPLPIHPAVFAAAASGTAPWKIFLWVIAGRLQKYLFFAWAAAKAPHLIPGFKKTS